MKLKLKKIDILLLVLFLISSFSFLYFKFIKENIDDVTINNNTKTTIQILPDTLIKLGTIKTNSIQEFKIRIDNHGINKLKIRDFTSSCGCTKIKCDKTNLNVGDSTFISGKLDTKNKFGPNISSVKFKANTFQGYHAIVIKYIASN